jgi:hypothetical protein
MIERVNYLTVLDETGALDKEDRLELFGLEQAIDNIDGLSMEGAEEGVTLIRDEFFEEYVKELAKWCGDLPEDLDESRIVIDWEATADIYRKDFHTVEFAGARYWFQ